MTNLEAAISVLASHREARRWSDDAVAADLLARLGLDPEGEPTAECPTEPGGGDPSEHQSQDLPPPE